MKRVLVKKKLSPSNLSHIERATLLASLFEVVVESGIKHRELGSKGVKVASEGGERACTEK